ncbi:MAG: hypothetical protein Q6J44_02010 [Gloeomargarita sp. DG02_4_bins_56]
MVQSKRWIGIVTLGFVGLAIVAAGVAAWLGYRIGQSALGKVRQPTLSLAATGTPNPDPEPFTLMAEEAVIQQVQGMMGTANVTPAAAATPDPRVRLPLLAVQEGGVYIALERVEAVGSQAVLLLRIQNERAVAVQLQRQFIVRDEQSHILEPEVEGLPVQLAPGNQATAVRVKLPAGLRKVRVGLTEVGQTIPFVELRDIDLEQAQPTPPTPAVSPSPEAVN